MSARIAERKGLLVETVLAGLAEEIVTYEQMPREALTEDIVRAIRLGIDLFLTTLQTGDLPSEDEWLDLGESAARRAEEGLPLSSVLTAYHTASRLVMEDLRQFCGPDDAQGVMDACVLVMRFTGIACDIVAERYMAERVAISDVDADLSADRLRRLLDGDPDPTDVAPAHVVVRFATGRLPDEEADGLTGEIALRRKLRRLRRVLRGMSDDVLGSVTREGGVLVLLVRDGNLKAACDRVPGKMARLESAAGVGVGLHAAVVPTGSATVVDATELSAELLDLVLQLGREPGIYRVEDVAIEYQMTRPGPARTLLAQTVAPLAARPDLLETLRMFLRTGQDRRATAQRLHVHPNTVDYRLQRVAEAIGVDPTDSRQAVSLVGAMLAFGAEQRDASE
ncbi:PucR family transcriptional regulator [Nocardioides yefusunii]|uniref:PucR family transcriptional regulator n=1 Tax=Nocardioides yefusunii TaxID=2500546 RepID=A0ABW1QYB1_9ACTN|nr:helix-turn-helix domain-containing protein [Nocardioides yefusunii]